MTALDRLAIALAIAGAALYTAAVILDPQAAL